MRKNRTSNERRRKVNIFIILFSALFLSSWVYGALTPSLTEQVKGQEEQVDPFYAKLFEDGKFFLQQGDYSEAIKNLEVAFFGYLDYPGRLLECYIYLEVCYFELKNYEKSKYYHNEIRRLKLGDQLKTIKPAEGVLDKYHEVSAYFARFETKGVTPSSPSPPPAGPKGSLPSASPSSIYTMEEEVKQLKQFIKNDKKNIESYFRLSSIYVEQKKYKEARATLEDLLRVDAKNGNAYFEIGKIYIAQNKPKEALIFFEKAVPFIPDNIELHYELGKVAYDLTDYARAKLEFGEVQRVAKNYKDTDEYLSNLEAIEKARTRDAQNMLALARRETDLDKKIKLYLKALEKAPAEIESYFELKDLYLAEKKYKEAVRLLEFLLKYYPDNIRIYVELGDVFLTQKSYDKAVKILNEGKQKDEANVELCYLLSRAYLGQKKYKEALNELDIVLARYPYYKDARELRRLCLEKIKK